MDNLEFVRVYPNGFFIITSGSLKKHLSKVEEVIKQIQSAGIKYNIDKFKFAVPKV